MGRLNFWLCSWILLILQWILCHLVPLYSKLQIRDMWPSLANQLCSDWTLSSLWYPLYQAQCNHSTSCFVVIYLLIHFWTHWVFTACPDFHQLWQVGIALSLSTRFTCWGVPWWCSEEESFFRRDRFDSWSRKCPPATEQLRQCSPITETLL